MTDGHTAQDLFDLQAEPGMLVRKPQWAHYPPKMGEGWNELYGGVVFAFSMKIEGEYAIAIGRVNPDYLWYCAPIQIDEAPSD